MYTGNLYVDTVRTEIADALHSINASHGRGDILEVRAASRVRNAEGLQTGDLSGTYLVQKQYGRQVFRYRLRVHHVVQHAGGVETFRVTVTARGTSRTITGQHDYFPKGGTA